MNLLDLNDGESGLILKVRGRGSFRKRIMEMGFITGKVVKAIKPAPFGDPVQYNILGYNVSLRNAEAQLIEISAEINNGKSKEAEFSRVLDNDHSHNYADKHNEKVINIALVGNPNSGKTTIFNYASGSSERVGNYSGVTIQAKEGIYKHKGYLLNIVDLPGTYSLSAYSPEEVYVRNNILNDLPDIVVNVIDASNLERNLYLTTQLIDMDIRVVVALNMYDEFLEKGDELMFEELGEMLGIPFVPTVGSKGKGISELFSKVIDVYEDRDKTIRHIHLSYGSIIEASLKRIQDIIYRKDIDKKIVNVVSSRFAAVKLIEKDAQIKTLFYSLHGKEEIFETAEKEIKQLEFDLGEDTETLITDSRYGFVAGALKENLKPGPKEKIKKSDIIDTIITHRFWGIPIFGLFMWLTFYITFNFGNYPKSWLEWIVQKISLITDILLPSGIVKDFLIQGIIGGIGGVIVFLPNILLLFLFISIMEDTGYMSRAVFIMDKAMHKIGLHGKSFIPLIMGFGCNVPAILASRTIESRRDRLITMLITPFMSCSARLPVYILFISAFFVKYQTGVLFLLYMIGVMAALLSSLLLGKTLFKKADMPFVMELPPYRIPTLRTLFKHMWFSARLFLKKISGVVMIATVVIWALGYFPINVKYSRNYDSEMQILKKGYISQKYSDNQQQNAALISYSQSLLSLKKEKETEHQEASFIGRLGKFIQPVMQPLGFDWKMTVSLMAGLAAKEVVVGTMGVLYQADVNDKGKNAALTNKLQEQTYSSGIKKGKKVFNPLVAFTFMLFVLIYFPCFGVVAAIKKESGKWKWAVFEIVFTTSLAWLTALIVYQVGNIFM
jgi:ferrous iron transport protein B